MWLLGSYMMKAQSSIRLRFVVFKNGVKYHGSSLLTLARNAFYLYTLQQRSCGYEKCIKFPFNTVPAKVKEVHFLQKYTLLRSRKLKKF